MRTIRNLLVGIYWLIGACFMGLSAQGYIAPPVSFNQYTKNHTRSTLPSLYSSVDLGYCLPPRHQIINGPCWAIANTDAAQTYLYKQGYETGYLSPQTLLMCSDGFATNISSGGNAHIAMTQFALLNGIYSNESIPYDIDATNCPVRSKEDRLCHLLNAYALPTGDTIAVKQAIMDYGSVSTAIYYNADYYNEETNTYNYTGNKERNHNISLVGWDDGRKAFLAKNTFGTSLFDKGYHWIAYTDVNVISECYAFANRVAAEQIDTVYAYDRSGMISSIGYSNHLVSTICKYEPQGAYTVPYVGFYAAVCDTLTCTLFTPSNQVLFSQTIVCPYPGHYALATGLNQPITGAIYLAVDYPSGHIPIENAIPDYNYPIFIPKGKQYIQFDNSSTYNVGTDCEYQGYQNINLCLQLYTKQYIETAANAINNLATPDINLKNQEWWQQVAQVDLYGLDGHWIGRPTSALDCAEIHHTVIAVIRYKNGNCQSKCIWLE